MAISHHKSILKIMTHGQKLLVWTRTILTFLSSFRAGGDDSRSEDSQETEDEEDVVYDSRWRDQDGVKWVVRSPSMERSKDMEWCDPKDEVDARMMFDSKADSNTRVKFSSKDEYELVDERRWKPEFTSMDASILTEKSNSKERFKWTRTS